MSVVPRLFLLCIVWAASSVAFGQGASPASTPPANSSAPKAEQQSLADMARKLRKDKPAEIRMTDADTKELFRSVDKVFEFASEDTGFPKRSTVKKALVGQADIEKFTKDMLARAEYSQRFGRAELTMKKFGLLPRDFNLREFLVKANGQSIGGLYDEETKTIWLLNTISIERQGPILAHELTHALQDQNYDLHHWSKAGEKQGGVKSSSGDQGDMNDEATTARHAIVEGQAMVVYLDYELAPFGRNLKDTPGVVASMEDSAISATIDTEMMHKAPMVLREAGSFPYRAGLFFEADILEKRGKQAAFQGVFAQPPRNTHEVFDSNAYLERAKLTPALIPDLHGVLSDRYELLDSGSFGELDVRALLKQFGDKHGAEDFAPAWQGGSYAAFKRTQAPTSELSTADVALLYVSRWKTPAAAEHFARFYATTVTKRYSNATVQAVPACSETPCPIGAALVSTEEGPVIVEQWSDNTVIVSESFDGAIAAKLSSAIRATSKERRAANAPQEELSMRLYALPAFRAFQRQMADEILRSAVSGRYPLQK
jgi:hypothetical protein